MMAFSLVATLAIATSLEMGGKRDFVNHSIRVCQNLGLDHPMSSSPLMYMIRNVSGGIMSQEMSRDLFQSHTIWEIDNVLEIPFPSH
jgi:hypothetical protein